MQVNILYIDATNQVFSSRDEFKEKGISGEYINNRVANQLFAEGKYKKLGGYSLGNEQDIRLLNDKMLLFINPLKKFVTIGLKVS